MCCFAAMKRSRCAWNMQRPGEVESAAAAQVLPCAYECRTSCTSTTLLSVLLHLQLLQLCSLTCLASLHGHRYLSSSVLSTAAEVPVNAWSKATSFEVSVVSHILTAIFNLLDRRYAHPVHRPPLSLTHLYEPGALTFRCVQIRSDRPRPSSFQGQVRTYECHTHGLPRMQQVERHNAQPNKLHCKACPAGTGNTAHASPRVTRRL